MYSCKCCPYGLQGAALEWLVVGSTAGIHGQHLTVDNQAVLGQMVCARLFGLSCTQTEKHTDSI